MKESLKFYHEILGLPLEWTGANGGDGSIANPTKILVEGLELFPMGRLKSKYGEDVPFIHFSCKCEPGNIERIVDELKAKGVKFTTELNELRYEDLSVPLAVKYIFFEDPSGIPLEIVEWRQL